MVFSILDENKINVTTSEGSIYKTQNLYSYYHYISGTFIIHKNFIDNYCRIYKEYLDKINNFVH